ncbi:nucleoside transporter family [Niveomyces insectorum RCEF 264]|uniref:Nucleoside transporter family n=1 Tax=Niveomyces insectorum RCEF 264 TaxID=1081102 RepID=A0A167M8Q9_9HYPO|nr:nucleoside transporter family [Niveomyces insectorum RCEF 264]
MTRGTSSIADRLRHIFARKSIDERDYAPINEERLALTFEDENGFAAFPSVEEGEFDEDLEALFSWVDYGIFALIGVAMLWAWNMFLAAAPYFQTRVAADPWIAANFQSTVISVSTCTNLAAVLVLSNIQYSASYPFRINTALLLNVVVFCLLTASTLLFLHASALAYLLFMVFMVSCSAWACGLIQNGAFAFAASFGRPEYTQAIMAGQGVAGVLPPIAQIATVLMFPPVTPPAEPTQTGSDAARSATVTGEGGDTSAFFYFLAAVIISIGALVAFQPLVKRHNRVVELRMGQAMSESMASIEEAERAARKVVGMKTLFFKLHWVALSVFMCFLVSMFFPVLTPKVLSVSGPPPPPLPPSTIATAPPTAAASPPSRILQPAAFIPLAFFFWNLGDLLGRVATMLPIAVVIQKRPVLLFAFSLARLFFLPLYFLCNLGGRGAVVGSDLFYLCLVQLPFGLTNGWLSSTAMMTAGEWVEEGEREAAGGFMSLCLVAGLAAGSFLSFSVGHV